MSELATIPEQPAAPAAPIQADERGLKLSNFAEMARFAKIAVNSGLAKSFASPEAVMIALQHGAELGLLPSQALQSIAVINGRPCVWGDAPLALAKNRPEFQDCIETWEGTGDKTEAICTLKRHGKADLTRTFSVEDAKRAGLWGKSGPWTQYPKRMLQMRARSWALRDAFPDALKGIGIAEEVRDTPAPVERAKLILPDDEPETPALPETSEARDEEGNFKF